LGNASIRLHDQSKPQKTATGGVKTIGKPLQEVGTMFESRFAVEMRFLVPPHLIEAARQAMSSFMIEEQTDISEQHMPKSVYPHCMLTQQELKVLLRE
jgi:hypothetical protein